MDHIFEQKLVRENQQLQFELNKLNKQIKQLQETVVGYEQFFSQVEISKEMMQEATFSRLKKLANKAFTGQARAAMGQEKIDVLKSVGKNIATSGGPAAAAGFNAAAGGRIKHLTGIVASGRKAEASTTGGGKWNAPSPGSPLDIAQRKRTASLKYREGKVQGSIQVASSLGKKTTDNEDRLRGIRYALSQHPITKSVSSDNI